MILRFPKGYDTPIGEAGNLLSGGQRQRIGLARAVYGEPALIVLDEPNANLDEAGNAALLVALDEVHAGGSTIVIVTHRSSVLKHADAVLLMVDGRAALHGKPDDVAAALRQRQASRSAGAAPAARMQEVAT
jgi:ATP-binding cassette subfamily C exporter for protease/lipase